MRQKLIVLVVIGVALYFLNKKQAQPAAEEGKKLSPHLVVIPKIFRDDDASADRSFSADGPAEASVDTSQHASVSYPCQCRVCLCKDPNQPLSEEEFKRLQEDLKKLGSSEFDAQSRIVDLQIQVDDLKAEKEQLLAQLAAYQKPVPVPYQPVYRPTFSSYCTGPSCQPQTYQRRGIFGRRR